MVRCDILVWSEFFHRVMVKWGARGVQTSVAGIGVRRRQLGWLRAVYHSMCMIWAMSAIMGAGSKYSVAP